MLLGRVKGTVVASHKLSSVEGFPFYLVQPVDEQERGLGDVLVALDLVASRQGDLVMLIDAREAPKAMPNAYGPVDACIVGIVDSTV
jgi:microcompartment protein CcmK/EutM